MRESYKKLLRLTIIVAIVYFSFRFLLPLFFPFLAAYVIAVILRRPVRFLWNKLKIRPAISGAALLILFLTVAGGGIFYAVKVLLKEFAAFVSNYDSYTAVWDMYAQTACGYFDSLLRLDGGSSFRILSDGLDGIVLFFREELVPFLTKNSLKAAISFTELAASVVIVFVAVLLFLTDMAGSSRAKGTIFGKKGKKEKVKQEEPSMFQFMEKEWKEVKQELSGAGIAYIKTQVILILLVSLVCSLGLFLIGNPYALLFGVVIGLLDALPVLGSGLILVPWAIVCFFSGNVFAGAVLLTLYGICQFFREYLEPKLLGGKMGMRPVHSLMAVYVGYELFGISGLFLGPFGLVLLKCLWRTSS